MNHGKKVSFSPLLISIFFHALCLAFLTLYPPTKSIIFFKIHKKTDTILAETKEKMLDEISVIKIPKKHSDESISELLSDEINTIEHEFLPTPHIDLSYALNEKIDLSFPIDSTLSFNLSSLEASQTSLESYLSPLIAPVPDDLLHDEEPIAQSYNPQIKPLLQDVTTEPEISQIDDLDFSSFVKQMPEMLDTELYTYTDGHNDEFFKMELKIKEHKLFDETPQEFLFVLDLTQKNVKTNIQLYKSAIIKSLQLLKPQDLFNVVILSKNNKNLFPSSRKFNKTSLDQIEELFKGTIKTEGRIKDLVKNLSSIFDKTEETDIHTHLIFFTDEPQKEKDQIRKLSKFAHSKLSFYPVLYGESSKRADSFKYLVDELGGKVVSPPTKASFIRKFSSLIMDIKRTRLRNVSIKLESENGPLDMSISEKTKQLTLKKPLKIFGKLKGSRQLKLKVVGSHGDDLYEMKKTISIHEAKKGSSLIKKEVETETDNP
jgi:von Willebrand factor type A domain